MWRDQVNILQDRSSDLSLDRGRDGEQRGRICTRLPIDICPPKNNNNKKNLILCQNIFLLILNTRNVSKTFDQNIFSYVTLYFVIRRADLIPFFVLFINLSLLLQCFYMMELCVHFKRTIVL